MLRWSCKSLILLGAAFSAVSAGWLSSAAQAGTIINDPAPVTLSSLLAQGETYQVGDKLFSGFKYLKTGEMPTAENINVAPIIDADDNWGIRFQGAFVDLASTPGGSDAFIEFMVEALDPGKLISDVHLEGNPTLLGTQGSISVVETFLPLGPGGEHTLTIFDDESAGQKLTDSTVFPIPVRKLNVKKDILVITTPQSGTVVLSYIDQTFSQTPEATTITMALIGLVSLAGAGGRGRRR